MYKMEYGVAVGLNGLKSVSQTSNVGSAIANGLNVSANPDGSKNVHMGYGGIITTPPPSCPSTHAGLCILKSGISEKACPSGSPADSAGVCKTSGAVMEQICPSGTVKDSLGRCVWVPP